MNKSNALAEQRVAVAVHSRDEGDSAGIHVRKEEQSSPIRVHKEGDYVGVHSGKPNRQPASLMRLAGCGQVSLTDVAARYQLSRVVLTRMTGFSLRAITNWSQGSKPSSAAVLRFTETKRLLAALERLVASEAIGPWLEAPNQAFDGSTPLQVIERGESDRIWRMVYELESGEPA